MGKEEIEVVQAHEGERVEGPKLGSSEVHQDDEGNVLAEEKPSWSKDGKHTFTELLNNGTDKDIVLRELKHSNRHQEKVLANQELSRSKDKSGMDEDVVINMWTN